MGLNTKMWLLVALLFAVLYGVITGVGTYIGAGGAYSYIVLAFLFLGFQYLIGPSMVQFMMRVKWVSEKEEPELHRMVAELAQRAQIPKPKVGVSNLSIPNAFAFGKSIRDGRICVTQGIQKLLSKEELRAVIGHEISHIKHRDMMIITLLSAIPLILYWIAWRMMWGGMMGERREGGGYAALVGMGAFFLYFLTNLLVLYGSRIREYYADSGSVQLGNPPHYLATALYKLVYGSARSRDGGDLKRLEGVKAFFLNDPSRAQVELKELSEVDRDMSGTIDSDELADLRHKTVKLGRGEKMMELLTTHPNMLKRIKHLASLN
ncbi:MAG: zinc metalloprotease HtpX [Thermodesulfobacteriota bacterium]|nr:zinc metalloprotease HtpX [Thermodesulfobacteriota bacterium]